MNFWHMFLRPHNVDQFAFCYDNNIVGINDPDDESSRDFNHFKKLIEERTRLFGEPCWKTRAEIFVHEMQKGDLVWVKNANTWEEKSKLVHKFWPDNKFYLGSIDDPKHCADAAHRHANIACFRKCPLVHVSATDVDTNTKNSAAFFEIIDDIFYKDTAVAQIVDESVCRRTLEIWGKIHSRR